jgi:sulfite reductase (ferredoxin)
MKEVKFSERVSEKAKKDIQELQNKIEVLQSGEMPEEMFRKFRLARGVYGQRQPGVQMIRIKLPYGKITADQLIRIADCSDKYATGNLHATTRQDIQLHFVKLADSPSLWAELEDAGITLKEACGNTVRNITASPTAGIDPHEPFDVSPYAQQAFEYFLRNPICQDMGRKFKIAFSSSNQDTAYAFIHDVGLIPKIVTDEKGEAKRGFQVLVGGGLGAQPVAAQELYAFLEEEYIIPLIEAIIRVFDRYGERTKRHKARMKYLLADVGLDEFLRLIEEEWPALKNKVYAIKGTTETVAPASESTLSIQELLGNTSDEKFKKWLLTNVFEQKQKGWYSVRIRVLLGDFNSDTARSLAALVKEHAADDIRVTANQGYILRYIKAQDLRAVFDGLDALQIATPGFDSTMDITTCPGTDTCNLAITSSYGITRVLEEMMRDEYPDLIYNSDIKIKISGCMNGCGQHSSANIGYHGSSLKHGQHVLPALQVLLGGGHAGVDFGSVGEKVIKIPGKRGPQSLRMLLDDFNANSIDGEYFNSYYQRKGKSYFYQLLRPLADLSTITEEDFRDYDHDEAFKTEIGVGECAGVMLDLVSTTLIEAKEKLALSQELLAAGIWADAIYQGYNTMITGAKALLLGEGISTNTQHGIMKDFDEHFGEYFCPSDSNDGFRQIVLTINKNEPSEDFARYYVANAKEFLDYIRSYREASSSTQEEPKLQELAFGMDS